MSLSQILDPEQSYTFRSYYEMPYELEDILVEFGYKLVRSQISLVQYPGKLPGCDRLAQQLRQRLNYVSLSSEAARRETLIAPIVLDAAEIALAQVRIEYPLIVNDWLRGTLDYYLFQGQHLLIIEAKQADLAKGFKQLAIELIALDQAEKTDQPILLGAVTTGDVWMFGQLYRSDRLIRQSTKLYLVPDELETLMRILVQALGKESES
ncbi:MAG: hypothetical protein VKJ24_15285 [Synechococcales bacterium]|nr:hypothetical protein [Synechococcales bacterium]